VTGFFFDGADGVLVVLDGLPQATEFVHGLFAGGADKRSLGGIVASREVCGQRIDTTLHGFGVDAVATRRLFGEVCIRPFQ